MKLIFTFLLLSVSFSLGAVEEASPPAKVIEILSYNQYGGGDVGIKINPTGASCTGYWFNKNDAGFNANLSMLLAAYQAKNNVVIYGDTESPWSATGAAYCRLFLVRLQ